MNVTRIGHQALASKTMSTEKLWHQRYGHLNHNDDDNTVQEDGTNRLIQETFKNVEMDDDGN